MRKYILMGVQGSGKGTQAKRLCQAFDLVHISVSDVFRWHIQNHTKLGARVKRLLAEGRLVANELVDEVVKTRLEEHDWNYGFVLDGTSAGGRWSAGPTIRRRPSGAASPTITRG